MKNENGFFTKGRLITAAIIVVLILLLLSLALLFGRGEGDSSSSTGNVIPSGDTQVITLGDETAKGKPFSLPNLFPGDRITQEYVLKVEDRVLAVTMGGELTDKVGQLSDVLKMEIKREGESETLYDGLVKNAPEGLRLPVNKGDSKIVLQITIYLDGSVGNEYTECLSEGRFSFWVAQGDLVFQSTPKQPRKVWPAVVGATVGVGSLGGFAWWLLLFLAKKKKAEEAANTVTDEENGGAS